MEVHLHCCHSVCKRQSDVVGDYKPILPFLKDAKIDRVNLEFAYKGTGIPDDLEHLPDGLGVGMGVVEAAHKPELQPNIPLPAHGFNLGMIQAETGNGAALHAHTTEEVFIPLVGAWAIIWMTDEGEKEIVLEPFDTISVPIGIYRGCRYVGEGKGTLLTLIGGPDAGRVDWHPSITTAAVETGLSRNEAGNLEVNT